MGAADQKRYDIAQHGPIKKKKKKKKIDMMTPIVEEIVRIRVRRHYSVSSLVATLLFVAEAPYKCLKACCLLA